MPNLSAWAQRKGIGVLGTGDFTHPGWFAELASLQESEPGLYSLPGHDGVRFLYQTEIASIYKQGDKLRRQHTLIFASGREAAGKIIAALERLGCNLKADGRPITGLKLPDLVDLVKTADKAAEIVPAHVWTPHFGLYGSLSGFDSLREAFGEQRQQIWAVETGLSSDPAMNWRVEDLDNITLISNSDAHSLPSLGREANALDLPEAGVSYLGIMSALQSKAARFFYTVEFYPAEGKYHWDGHRDCHFSCAPEETQRLKGVCPECGKQLLRGVMGRVEALSGRAASGPGLGEGRVPFRSLIPLEEIMAAALGVGVGSKKVQQRYLEITDKRPELEVLLDASEADLEVVAGVDVARLILACRAGRLSIDPGYDGVYGRVHFDLTDVSKGTLF